MYKKSPMRRGFFSSVEILSASQPCRDIDRKTKNSGIEQKTDDRMRQHRLAQRTRGHRHIRSLHCDADGKGKIKEVPIVRIALAISKTQGQIVTIFAIEQPRIMQGKDGANQQP